MTHRCAVIGNPIAHSQSPAIHAAFAQATGIALRYDRILGEADTFADTVQQFFAEGGKGMNVTVPFKVAALELADYATENAQLAGAANTLWLDDGKLWADNTDGRGLVNALRSYGISLSKDRVLIIGAGGAAQGVYGPLHQAGADCVDIANRTVSKAEAILDRHPYSRIPSCRNPLGTVSRAMPLDAIVEDAYDLIINATSTGLDDSTLILPQGIFEPYTTTCYDMVYGKDTPFLQWARQQDHANGILDGRSMLIEQARLSFERWFGIRPPYPETEEKPPYAY
ncbi:shikimate dehydrogenase [Cardiobacteriaceae bacterium TAE3-ERU3]|nr:shikimate dehydrogenase [Cardiobacteriaceae bacterium TAE3-ERU3]